MTAVGWYLLDATAKRAVDTGSSDGMGVRGIVIGAHTDWANPETGEVDDLYVVATRHHGQLRFEQVFGSDVGDSWPCGRIDATGYIGVCQREIARTKRGQLDARIVDVLTLATRIKENPATPDIGGMPAPEESILERADRERQADPDLQAAYERMQAGINERRRAAGRPPIEATR